MRRMSGVTSPAFLPEDIKELARRGVSTDAAAEQLALLRHPPAAVVLDRPCTVGDGIAQIDPESEEALLDAAAHAAAEGRITKFVPASGAATRMFKDLAGALNAKERPSANDALRRFFAPLDDYPFAEELRTSSGIGGAIEDEAAERKILSTLLEEMDFARKPKALIPFHRGERVRTAFEEQLLEATRYARDGDGVCRIHFTVAPEWREDFAGMLRELAPGVEQRTGGAKLDVTFSEQHPSTDTLAIDHAGAPFRDGSGTLVFRPGGHGALLHNLQKLEGDIVVIKNIDNIVPFEASELTVRWKQLLIGSLVRLQADIFTLLEECSGDEVSASTLDDAIDFCASVFGRAPRTQLADAAAKREFVTESLDRPLRVCGVVKNEGEPGGAPFWVRGNDGTVSVQIVESSQVDMNDPQQRAVFNASTHFNPVDIVCGLRSWRGESFDLDRFVDPSTVFLSKKSFEGRELTALERPGLWNGAMARWNTVFVEVPAATFAPVKTVFDLLRPEHQPR